MRKWIRKLKDFVKEIPLAGAVFRGAYGKVFGPKSGFVNSTEYWNDRYLNGGTSGQGSYGRLAEYKASFLNSLVSRYDIETVIELGCGDGSQLQLFEFKSYLGFDVSQRAVEVCSAKFADDKSKRFKLLDDYNHEQ